MTFDLLLDLAFTFKLITFYYSFKSKSMSSILLFPRKSWNTFLKLKPKTALHPSHLTPRKTVFQLRSHGDLFKNSEISLITL